jgi:hypothetical protein
VNDGDIALQKSSCRQFFAARKQKLSPDGASTREAIRRAQIYARTACREIVIIDN